MTGTATPTGCSSTTAASSFRPGARPSSGSSRCSTMSRTSTASSETLPCLPPRCAHDQICNLRGLADVSPGGVSVVDGMFSQDATQGQATAGKSADADYLHGGAAIVALQVMGCGNTGCENLTR